MLENRVENYNNRFNKNGEETYLSQEDAHINNHLFISEISGTNLSLKEKEDHLLYYEIESEERKNDIIINVSRQLMEKLKGILRINIQNFFNNVYAFDYYPISVIKDINKLGEDKKRCAIYLENFQNEEESIIIRMGENKKGISFLQL